MLDLDHQRSAVVSKPAFEGDAELARAPGGAFIHGMDAARMAATGKHFPGTAGPEADSHRHPGGRAQPGRDPVPGTGYGRSAPGAAAGGGDAGTCDLPSGGRQRPGLFSRGAGCRTSALRGELGFDGVISSDVCPWPGAHVVRRRRKPYRSGAERRGATWGWCNDRASARAGPRPCSVSKVQPPCAPGAHARGVVSPVPTTREQPRWLLRLPPCAPAQLID